MYCYQRVLTNIHVLNQSLPQKGFGEFRSAVCDTIYTIYLSLCKDTTDLVY